MLSRTSTTLLNSMMEEPADQAAWRRFCSRYGPAVFRFARRRGLGEAESDEVLAATLEVFVEKFRDGEYRREIGRLRSWVFGIAMNKVREARRHLAGREREVSIEELPSVTDETDQSPDPQFRGDLEQALAWECLDSVRRRVAPLTYQAFDLYVMKGRKPEDVARLLGMDKPAVYVAKSRVLSAARREYDRLRTQQREET